MPNPVPLPSLYSPAKPTTSVVLPDDRVVNSLIEQLLNRAGLPEAELARRLGIKRQSLNQYKISRRRRPSVQWLARLAEACGARLLIEFPAKPL